jgi:hypothetical protein
VETSHRQRSRERVIQGSHDAGDLLLMVASIVDYSGNLQTGVVLFQKHL